MPGTVFYESVKIDEDKGEKWFCSEEEAEEAGWEKAKYGGRPPKEAEKKEDEDAAPSTDAKVEAAADDEEGEEGGAQK